MHAVCCDPNLMVDVSCDAGGVEHARTAVASAFGSHVEVYQSGLLWSLQLQVRCGTYSTALSSLAAARNQDWL